MANYTKTTDFSAKDALATGNPAKIITGTAHDTEYNNIATAISSKADIVSANLTTPNIGAATGTSLVLSGLATVGTTLGVTGVLTASGGVSGNLTGNVTGNSSGDHNGTVGATTPAAGTFTTLTATSTTTLATALTGVLRADSGVVSATAVGTVLSNSIGANVLLNNVGQYFTGPTVAQGTSGTWLATGTVTLSDSTGASVMNVKLWDGTTVISSTTVTTVGTTNMAISLSGYITSPAGNIRISVNDPTNATGAILSNASGNSKDSTLTVVRIA
jgi:hypothetical protein